MKKKMPPTELQLAVDNLRYDISLCRISGLAEEKIRQRINKIEAGIKELTEQVKQ
jgi:hypothetical protein